MASAKDLFVTEWRTKLTAWWTAQKELESLADEFNARGWSGQIAEGDLSDQNYDVTPQQFSNSVGSVAATTTLLGEGHATNIASMVRRSG